MASMRRDSRLAGPARENARVIDYALTKRGEAKDKQKAVEVDAEMNGAAYHAEAAAGIRDLEREVQNGSSGKEEKKERPPQVAHSPHTHPAAAAVFSSTAPRSLAE